MKPQLLYIGVAASFFSTALLADDTLTDGDADGGIQVMTLDAGATIEEIDADKRELARLNEQLEIAKTRGELQQALSNNERVRAGSAMVEALQRDLQGYPRMERDATAPPNRNVNVPPGAASAPSWGVFSTSGYNGDWRAEVVSPEGQRVSVRVGTELDGGGRVVSIAHRTVKVRRDGDTQTLPPAAKQVTSDIPPVRSYEPFTRNASSFNGAGSDATGRGQ